ncbi:oxysterol-binding protein 1-like [Planococcus citri]|uniref:oxysterol-binding protein 1-like n=1 Tax=Planococcus citri TaxID=170843 RepID=UPI0031F94E4A
MAEKATRTEPDMQGWLLKWTNYVKGYQRRWFVLSNGLLSYYRNQAEMVHTCRGTISLHGAFIHTEDSCTFVISNGGAQTFYIKASNEVERQTWVTALELAKAKAIQQIETDSTEDSVSENAKVEVMTAIKVLSQKMEDLQICNDLIIKHGNSLQKSLSELESTDAVTDINVKVKSINERATLFRIASNTMINTCLEYLELAQSQGKKWQKMLQHEREQRIQLEEMVEQLAREQSALERVSKPLENTENFAENSSSEDENTEFYDAQGGENSDSSSVNYLEKRSRNATRRNSLSNTQMFDKIVSEELAADDGSSSDVDDMTESAAILTAAIRSSATIKNKKSRRDTENNTLNNDRNFSSSRNETLLVLSENAKNALEEVKNNPRKKGTPRRCRIPDKPHHPLHIWSIMKNCIGKDLSKIPMPVNFSEPLSMLQRLAEDFEYANVLDAAAKCTDPFERLAYIAAFTISSYSTTTTRTGKPFNPLLGETYECDRSCDLGWRAVSEQVSHHPPIAAQHCEGKSWISWQEFTMSSKFRGKYLQLTPSGTSHLQFKDSDDYYTWCKVTTTVHNIIVGKLWVDQEGEMEIINHKNGSKCRLTYVPYSYFARDQQRKVKGIVINKQGEAKWMINGTWDNKVEIAPVTKVDKETGSWQTGSYVAVWQRILPSIDSEKYYNFTELACQLNEMEENIAPTDSRLRPDQRLMELGMWDEANIEKLRLEEKQRQKRKERNFQNEDATECGDTHQTHEPVWFRREMDTHTGDYTYSYNNLYWDCKDKRDWSRCPSIF